MTPQRNPGPSITLNAKTLAWIASLLAVLYALNRPVQAFQSLSASVDKLATAVSRIDLTTTDQGKSIDQLKVDGASAKAAITGLDSRLSTLEQKK